MLRELAEPTERLEEVELRFVTGTKDEDYKHKHEYFYEHTEEWGYVFTEYKHHRSPNEFDGEWEVITHNWWDVGSKPTREVPDCVKEALKRRLEKVDSMR